jgi:hypothetical protein
MSIRVIPGNPPQFIDLDTGLEITEAEATPQLSNRQKNRLSIETKARAAIATNAQNLLDCDAIIDAATTFLAIPAPTTAQRNAYVNELARNVRELARQNKQQARQLNGLNRNLIRDLSADDA